jgi:hypothetical protein
MKETKCGSATREEVNEMMILRTTTVPSSFRACHHFPFLSVISKISPLEISLGSSGDAVSVAHHQHKSE